MIHYNKQKSMSKNYVFDTGMQRMLFCEFCMNWTELVDNNNNTLTGSIIGLDWQSDSLPTVT